MYIEKGNIIKDKSYEFSIKIIKLYKQLSKSRNEYILSKQLLRCGTSIGANVEEATGGITRNDFKNKLFIAYKEAREAKYWLRLLKDTDFIDAKDADELLDDCEEILRILGKIISSLKK